MRLTKKETNEKIKKSMEIIKKEKQKIKAEKKKNREDKIGKNKLLKKIFNIKEKETVTISLKEQILSMIYFQIVGVILCLLVLFVLSGGRNYIKLYIELKKLINVYDTIESNYYGELDKHTLIDSAIDSMLDSIGDDYTTYTDNNATNIFLEDLEGTYEGIGCMVSMTENREIIVISTFEDGPAKKAGLEPNDIILKIDDKEFKDKTSEDMANYVKQSTKPQITLTVKRGEEEIEIVIKRAKVETPSVTSKVIEKDDKKIGYMDISIFSAVTYNQFKKQLDDLENKNIEALIIDVRNDTGGYLSSVTDISSLFLKKGKIIYQLEDDKSKEKIKDTSKEHREYPVAVLINGASASASEILAATIKESYGGIVIGTNSYGKGTVQKTKTLPDGSMIKYTAQKWLTPKGHWVNEVGVEPTTVVELDVLNYTNGVDNQLDTAVSQIIEKLN